MNTNDKILDIIKKFADQREESNKRAEEHLENVYRQKENSLTNNIKAKTREFKDILLKNGFEEAEFHKESRLWKWKYYKPTLSDVAFVVNLEPYDNYVEIYYGFASTAFTKMAGSSDALKKHGIDSDEIAIRNMIKYTYGEDESLCLDAIKSFYNQYNRYSKDELLILAKEKRKEFINDINLELKSLGFKKKGATWSIPLNQYYKLSFILDKSRFCDCYRFYYEINNVENVHPVNRCHICQIAYEYKSQRNDFNWQCYSKAELDEFLKFISKDILLPIINADVINFGKLIAELNSLPNPRLFVSRNEDIKFYNSFRCDLDKCSQCYKK